MAKIKRLPVKSKIDVFCLEHGFPKVRNLPNSGEVSIIETYAFLHFGLKLFGLFPRLPTIWILSVPPLPTR